MDTRLPRLKNSKITAEYINPASILYKCIVGRYRPVSYPFRMLTGFSTKNADGVVA